MLLWHISLCDSPSLPPSPSSAPPPPRCDDRFSFWRLPLLCIAGTVRQMEVLRFWPPVIGFQHWSRFWFTPVVKAAFTVCLCRLCDSSVSFCWFLCVSVRLSIDRLYFCVVLKLFILTRRSPVSMRPFGKTRLNKKRLTATIVFFVCWRLYLHSVESYE